VQTLKEQVFQNYIGGRWTDSVSGQTYANLNPADVREVVGNFQDSTQEDAVAAIEAAAEAFAGWKKTPIGKRAGILMKAAALLEERAETIAEELTREEGKSLALAKGEVMRSAETLRFYAVEGQTFTGETFPQDDPDMVVYTQLEPLDVVTVISPWNFQSLFLRARSRRLWSQAIPSSSSHRPTPR